MHQRRETGSINDLLRFTPTAIIHILSDITMKTGTFPVGLLGCAPAQPNLLLLLRQRVNQLIDPGRDSVRWYPLCRPCYSRIVQQGAGGVSQDEGFYLV